jgi:hypothetical protein
MPLHLNLNRVHYAGAGTWAAWATQSGLWLRSAPGPCRHSLGLHDSSEKR